jgi:hypothetical protein
VIAAALNKIAATKQDNRLGYSIRITITGMVAILNKVNVLG